MCGIAGFFGSDTTDLFNTPELLRELLEGIEHRGREATGVSWWGADNDKPAAVWPMLLKAPMAATQFVHEYEATLSDAANTNLVIAHTRLPTQGDKRHAVNNHPIDHGLIVGVHNGCVYNDAEIFRQLDCDRFGEVDSEAIFALLSAKAKEHEPGIDRASAMASCLEDIIGSMAIAFFVKDEPGTLYLARGASSPLFVSTNNAADLVFASTPDTITDAVSHMPCADQFKAPIEIASGTFMRFTAGEMTDNIKFTPDGPPRRVSYGWYRDDYDPSQVPHRTPTQPQSFPYNSIDAGTYARRTTWIDTELTEHEFAALAENEPLWDTINDQDLLWFTGLYSQQEQQNVLFTLLENAFMYPPVNIDRSVNVYAVERPVRAAVTRMTERLLDKRDKRPLHVLRREAYNNLATTVQFDPVRCKIGNSRADGWFVCHTEQGAYPNQRVIVAVPDRQQVVLRMLSNWNVEPRDSAPSEVHNARLDYIETLAIEHAYCVTHEQDVQWPFLDFETLPAVMHTRQPRLMEVN